MNGDPWGSEDDVWRDMAVGIVSTVLSPVLWFAGVERASTLRSILDGIVRGQGCVSIPKAAAKYDREETLDPSGWSGGS